MAGERDKWEFYKDPQGEWRWRRTATNGEIVGAATEGYKNRAMAVKNAMRPAYGDKKDKDKWDFYRDEKGYWRWRRRASNGLIVGASCQGYVRRIDCVRNAERVPFKGE
jgi:uncharacterized protein YegP (UPF0339 family)